MTGGALLVVGATSGAGKSTVVAGLCRSLARRGLGVAPFKAQNMSNHAAVTPDGGEIGRAQAMQAAAAGVELDRRMNPILLKPSSERGAHLVVDGDERAVTDADDYGEVARSLRPTVLAALNGLRRDHDWVIAEGAGGAAEINLLDRDLVNLPLARAAGLPALLVVDIDRGGAFAAAHGTIDLVPDELRDTIVGVVFNQFRGDVSLLAGGLRDLEARNGVPVLGVLPHLGPRPLLGVEDSLDLEGRAGWASQQSTSDRPLRIVAIRLPHLSNPSDLDPLALEPDVTLRWGFGPGDVVDADLIVLPGSRATVADLAWLRDVGLDRAIAAAPARGAHVLGLCGGYQMLGRAIDDDVESQAGTVTGLGLLAIDTVFEPAKVVRRSHGSAQISAGDGVGEPVVGYEIRFGRPRLLDNRAEPWLRLDTGPEGARSEDGQVRGTSLHGLFDSDELRRAYLAEIAAGCGRQFRSATTGWLGALEAQHDALADWVEAALDVDALLTSAAAAARPGEGPGW